MSILIETLAKKKIPLHDLKLQYIYAVIKSFSGDRAKASRVLQMDETYLYKFVKQQGWTEFYGHHSFSRSRTHD